MRKVLLGLLAVMVAGVACGGGESAPAEVRAELVATVPECEPDGDLRYVCGPAERSSQKQGGHTTRCQHS